MKTYTLFFIGLLANVFFVPSLLGCEVLPDPELIKPPKVITLSDHGVDIGIKRAVSYDEIRLPEVAWADFFYRCHSNGAQHFLVCGLNPKRYDMYISAIKKLLIGNSECRLTVVTKERKGDFTTRSKDLTVPCDCKYDASDETDAYSRSTLYREIRATKLIQNNTVLRYLHFLSIPENQDFPEAIPSQGMNSEKYSAIFLSKPRDNYETPFSWLNKRGILYIPYKAELGTNKIIGKLVEAGFRRRNIVVTGEVICACKIDPNDFHPAHIRAVEKDLLRGELKPSEKESGTFSHSDLKNGEKDLGPAFFSLNNCSIL